MIRTTTDFPYLGTRKYIHGTSILNFVLDHMEKETKVPVKLKTIRFQKEIHSNGSFYFSEKEDLKDLIQKADCYVACNIGNEVWKAVYIEEGLKVEHTVPETAYSIENMIPDNSYGGSCHIKASSRPELISNMIQANKRMHLAGLSDSQQASDVRFGYMEKWDVPRKDINLQTRLDVKNIIFKKNINDIMTINKISYSDGLNSSSLILCFKIVLKEKKQ
jgi:hypothetical protein